MDEPRGYYAKAKEGVRERDIPCLTPLVWLTYNCQIHRDRRRHDSSQEAEERSEWGVSFWWVQSFRFAIWKEFYGWTVAMVAQHYDVLNAFELYN